MAARVSLGKAIYHKILTVDNGGGFCDKEKIVKVRGILKASTRVLYLY
jgi:hypothetical protein